MPSLGTKHRNDRNNPILGLRVAPRAGHQAGDQGHTGPFCHVDAGQEKAVIQPGLLPCSSPPCCSSPAAQPWFRIQASLFLEALRKAPADASSDEDYSPAALQGRSQRVVYPAPRGCVARWQLYRGPVSPFDCTTRGDQSYTKSTLEKQKQKYILQAAQGRGGQLLKSSTPSKSKCFQLLLGFTKLFFFVPIPAARDGQWQQEVPGESRVAAPRGSRSTGRTATQRFHELQH